MSASKAFVSSYPLRGWTASRPSNACVRDMAKTLHAGIDMSYLTCRVGLVQASSMSTSTDRPLHMSGQLAPVPDEIDARDLRVEGALPPELTGRYFRNG